MTGTIRHGSERANGFTLVELLIVLAILALMAGLTIPRLFGVISRSRLQQAAQQLAGDLATARLFAIQSGSPYQVRFESAGSHYTIRPQHAPNSDSMITGLGPEESLPTANPTASRAVEFQNQTNAPGGNPGLPIPSVLSAQPRQRPTAEFIDDELTGGIRFDDGNMVTDQIHAPAALSADEHPIDQNLSNENISAITPMSLPNSRTSDWTPSVIFYPDGRAEKQDITLADKDGRSVQLIIRGITGGVTIGPITRPRTTTGVDEGNDGRTPPGNVESTTIAESENALH